MIASERGAITAHFISHWGVPKDIRPRKVSVIPELALLEFGPKATRSTWRYATNGMSSYIQNCRDSSVKVRTEVFACALEKNLWIDNLLAAIATYPSDYSTYLAEGDTIEVGRPLDRGTSCYTGVLFAPPSFYDSATLGLVGGTESNILVHQVVGLFSSEVEFAKQYSGKRLLQKLMKLGELPLDHQREKVA